MNKCMCPMLGLAIAAYVPLVAQSGGPKFDVGVAYINQLDSAKAITNNSTGYAITGAAYWTTKSEYVIRTGIGINFLPGSTIDGRTVEGEPMTHNGVKMSLTGFQLYADLMVNTPWPEWRVTTGLSLQKWRYSSTVRPGAVNHITEEETDATGSIWGAKFGARLGVEFAVSKEFVIELMFQQTELGSNEHGDVAKGNVGSAPFLSNENPGWVQLGLRYHF